MRLNKIFITLLLASLFYFCSISAQETEFKQKVSSKIDSLLALPDYSNIKAGIAIYALDDKNMLYENNSQRLFVPASNMKLVTSACALSKLGPDF
ncbi:MAG TPA: D-alanyl-D-alanine carboxypeptidase, partial [candidate division Zixibacteria bacterium]|nr:D-alanyl-D-alanine carboxypeptidase [candidate division Zixibacteria bacterium]